MSKQNEKSSTDPSPCDSVSDEECLARKDCKNKDGTRCLAWKPYGKVSK